MAETIAVKRPGSELGQENVTPRFDNSYVRLPDRFFARQEPGPVAAPRLICVNRPLAVELNIDPDWLDSPPGIEMLAGNRFPDGAQPIALAYAGHQFGNFVPQLGDGRALLLGELIDVDGIRRDLQLKGSGPTRFSRNGDGRAALGPVLREYIVSEAMAALGIPTTRALAAVLTGDPVFREKRLPGAILARVAVSHVRIGTFQFFAARDDMAAVKTLADYVIARHFPELAKHDEPYLALLEAVISAQAGLVARWMLIGFIHGVMNTDNMTISGETIDYGPCAFMDEYDPSTVYSSIDANGRYAYANQPGIAAWNLTRFAETLLPLLHDDIKEAVLKAEDALRTFQPSYEAVFHRGLRRKLGLLGEEEGDMALAGDLLATMVGNHADFTLTFRGLADEFERQSSKGETRLLFADPGAFDGWAMRWRQRLSREPDQNASRQVMLSVNPLFIPRNHRVEAVITAAVEHMDFGPFEELLTVVGKPFEEQPAMVRYANPPEQSERILQTFCGT